MKKQIITLCAGILLFSGIAHAESCANGAGKAASGANGNMYCMSTAYMNWWSAFAWCEAIGGSLVDVTEDCACTGSSCPTVSNPNGNACINMYPGGSALASFYSDVWTRNEYANNTQSAYRITLNTAQSYVDKVSKTYTHRALCRM